jgi:hypothetical protein
VPDWHARAAVHSILRELAGVFEELLEAPADIDEDVTEIGARLLARFWEG